MTDISPNAYKAIVLLKRKKGTTKEDLLKWLLEKHSRYALEVDEILKYTGSLVVAPGPHYEFPDGEPPFDLINEIWCKDRESLDRAYAELNKAGGPAHTVAAVSTRVSLVAAEYIIK